MTKEEMKILRLIDYFNLTDIKFSCLEVASKFIELEQDIRIKEIVKEATKTHIYY